jgi:hypothetical protein
MTFGPAAPVRHLVLAPVDSQADVWAQVWRTFPFERVEQLPLRARLLDLLEQLDRGHLLALAGATVPTVWLSGQPDLPLLAGVLFGYGYVQIAGRHRVNRNIVYFKLSPAGRSKLHEGRRWWNGLTPLQRLKVRLLG